MTAWIEDFLTTYANVASPEPFKIWGAVSLVASALERKTWIYNAYGTLYPNMYIMLIGPPGVGKTIITSRVWRLFSKLSSHKLSSSSVTRATVIAELAAATRVKQHKAGIATFNHLFICINELGVLLPEYDTPLLNKLTDIYDGLPYSESRRDKENNVSMEKPLFNMLAAGTPGFLSHTLPDVAWEQGFMARCIVVYSAEVVRSSLFTESAIDKEKEAALFTQLRYIAELYGEFTFTKEAAQLLDDFYMFKQDESRPLHPRLQFYCTRRTQHMIKLMMIASAAEDASLIIKPNHFDFALSLLTDTEHAMPQVFKAMSAGGDAQIINETWYYIFTEGARRGSRSIPEADVIAFLSTRAPSEKIKWIIDVMLNSNLMVKVVDNGVVVMKAKGNPRR